MCIRDRGQAPRGEGVRAVALVDEGQRRFETLMAQVLYFGYDYAAPFLPQLEKNLHWLDAEFAKLTEYQQKRNNASK